MTTRGISPLRRWVRLCAPLAGVAVSVVPNAHRAFAQESASGQAPATVQPAKPDPAPPQEPARRRPTPSPPAPVDERLAPAVVRGVEIILAMQEGDGHAEWPYEGVYRVGGQIPIGYRVGGTAISAIALITAPGYRDDQPRQGAVHRAAEFVIKSVDHKLMDPAVGPGVTYDVRGWGYTYGLSLLLRLKSLDLMPADLAEPAEGAVRFFIDALGKTEIPEAGGWNYARRAGFEKPGAPSPFMTAPSVQALLAARAQGYKIDEGVLDRAIAALERARTPSGGFAYAGDGARSRDLVPGAVGRMVAAETTLLLAGRSSQASVRGAVDAFINYWGELNTRRAQPGTHDPAHYSIAPYYFYYAHHYAAQAVELLPAGERPAYRRKINDLLFSVRQEDGSWNDRVFPRSANFGTAMAVLAITMPDALPLLGPKPAASVVPSPPPAPPPAPAEAPG